MNEINEINEVKQFREKHGLTQAALGIKIERSVAQISKLECGVCKISKDVLFRLGILEKDLSSEKINTRANE